MGIFDFLKRTSIINDNGWNKIFTFSDTALNGHEIWEFMIEGLYFQTGNMKDGKKDGLWKCRVGSLWKWQKEDGKLAFKINYKEGIKHGLQRVWREDHVNIANEGSYQEGKKEGIWKWYHENGQLKVERNWKDGKIITQKWWDENGNEINPVWQQAYLEYHNIKESLESGEYNGGLVVDQLFCDVMRKTIMFKTNKKLPDKITY